MRTSLLLLLITAAACKKGEKRDEPEATGPATPSTPHLTGTDEQPRKPTTTAPPAGAAVKFCTMITSDEVAAIMGEPMKINDDSDDSCEYIGPEDEGKHAYTVAFKALAYTPGYAKSDGATKQVEGLGDRATEETMADKLSQLQVAKGSKALLVNVSTRTGDPALSTKSKAIATKILTKL